MLGPVTGVAAGSTLFEELKQAGVSRAQKREEGEEGLKN